MKALRTAFVFACVALVAACSDGSAVAGTTTALTEPQVRAFVDEVEAATYTDDDRAVTEPALADDFRITWRSPGDPVESMGKDEYIQDLEDTRGLIEDVEYSYTVGDVRVAADGRSATAEVVANETLTYDGSVGSASMDQVYEIELRDGHPQIVAITSQTTSLTVDGEKQF